jgi:hypothetical protein
MSHNFDGQRRETFNTFRDMPKGMKKLPERAEVDFLFYPEEHDANYPAFMKALSAKGFRCARDEELVVATIGPIPVTAEAIWTHERVATEVALSFDFYPDGWDLGLDG